MGKTSIGFTTVDGAWNVTDESDAKAFAETCVRWANKGVRIIGGCCGVGPQYIVALKSRLDADPKSKEN